MLHRSFSRRELLQFASLAMGGRLLAAAETPDWIKSVATAPQNVPEPSRPLADLLTAEDGTPISTIREWEKRRETIRADWTKFLQPLDVKPPSNEYRVLSTEQVGRVVRQKISYLAEPDLEVPAYLLIPMGKRPEAGRPGIVALHPTTAETIDPIAGLSGPEEKQSGLHLAQAGFVVICPENFLWQGAASYREAVQTFQTRYPNSLGMSKMLFDARRALDVLQTVDGVNPDRIGAFGHSLGAKEVLYLAAFDRRIKSAVFSEGGIAFDSTNWDAPWYLGKGIHVENFPLNHHQLLALVAPRPFLILGGERGRGAADGLRSWPYVAAAQKVYELYQRPDSLACYIHGKGHAMPPEARTRMIEWLQWDLA